MLNKVALTVIAKTMEEMKQLYVVELINGTLIKTGSFLAYDKNGNTYFAGEDFFEAKHEIFLDLEDNEESKFAVIFDEEGTNKWNGFTFKTIQFISSNKTQCFNFRQCKIREEELLLHKMDLIEKQLGMMRSNSNQLLVEKIKAEIETFEIEIKQIKEVLNMLSELKF